MGLSKMGYSSFGKASVSSSFSVKSGGSTGNENLDSLLKTISKEPLSGAMSLQESVNDANSIRLSVNKTSELESNTGTLNNKTKLANVGGAPLPTSQIKCNILKGSAIAAPRSEHSLMEPISARAEEESTKKTNQLFVKSATTSNNNGLSSDEPLGAATFVSVVSDRIAFVAFTFRCPQLTPRHFPSVC